MSRRGNHLHRIVTGTRTGPDLIIRLADGSPAIVEVKGGRSVNQIRPVLSERYGYLLDTFKLFYVYETDNGHWQVWRVKRSGCEKVEPGALNG